MRLHYQNITTYRELPSKVRIIYPEGSQLPPVNRYLQQVDRSMEYIGHPTQYDSKSDDLVSFVFANQLRQHAINSYHMAHLVVDRQALAERHSSDIDWRLNELMTRKPLRRSGAFAPVDDGKLTDVEKQILDLEKQDRQIQIGLWGDILDLRKDLVDERREYGNTRARMNYLGGGYGAWP